MNTSVKIETTNIIRSLNKTAVFDIVREEGPLTRSEIARKLDISLPTVMRVTNDLIDKKLIMMNGEMVSHGGRPSPLLAFNPHGHAVMGIDLGGTKMFGTIADLAGNIQHEIYVPWNNGDAQNSLQSLYQLIDTLKNKPRPQGQDLSGIGIGAPGFTIWGKGIVKWAPSLGWRDFPLQDLIQEKYGLPVLVENDVNLAALGEYTFGAGKNASSLVCIAIGTGIGSGIVINRKILHGFNYTAGEVGYLLPDVSFLGKRFDGFGALEQIASGTGVAEQAIAALKDRKDTPLEDITSEFVFNSARQGEAWAREIVNSTIDYISLAIASISVIVDPEMIVLGGGVSREGDMLIEPIRQRLEGAIPVVPKLVQSDLGYRASVMGAIAMILDLTADYKSLA
jgi:glucokinase-like ROK family protein